MSPEDDIPDLTPSSAPKPGSEHPREVGPESESRGGPEAADEALDDPRPERQG